MRNKKYPICFVRQMDSISESLDSIVLSDELGLREVFPYEVHALFELKDQIQMMLDEGSEMGFLNIVTAAKELETTFKETVRKLGLVAQVDK